MKFTKVVKAKINKTDYLNSLINADKKNIEHIIKNCNLILKELKEHYGAQTWISYAIQLEKENKNQLELLNINHINIDE